MSSIRLLKKELNTFSEELKQEIQTYLKFHPDFSREKAVELTMEIDKVRKNFIQKIHTADDKGGEKLKKYYSDMVKDMKKELDKVMENLSA
ncbi:MAG: hypothetical protein GVY19_09585 [Bacteroidetes bacterium]|jgi:predicted translin family RNA/ssDNA-binding protein|nr:hypothetical protein [Bacteroidota bacterium]